MKKDKNNPTNLDDDGYLDAIQGMAERAKTWASNNPGSNARIHWNYPHDAVVLCTLIQGIMIGYVKPNRDGLKVLEAMCKPMEREPTVIMVRRALDPDYNPSLDQKCDDIIDNLKAIMTKLEDPNPPFTE